MTLSIKNPSVKFIIFVLMICTFSIGYTEYAVMGILTSIANDFHIQVSSAGLLVTAYAASVCLTGPLVTIISVKLAFDERTQTARPAAASAQGLLI